jgi:CheY-specific phosphatase CheX
MNELSNEMKEALRKTVEELKKMVTPQLARKLNEHSLTPFAKTIELFFKKRIYIYSQFYVII